MGQFLDALLRRKALTATPAVLEVASQRRLDAYIPLGGTNLRTDRINSVYVATQNATYGWIYRTQPSVQRVVEYLAGNVAQLGLKLYERVADDDREEVGDHPAAEALRWPNPWTPGRKFVRTLITDFCVYGNAYALKFRESPGSPLILVNLSPAMVGLIGLSNFQPEGYRIWRKDGSSFDVLPDDIFHWRGENPEDPRVGISKFETLREEVAADAAARQANTELHRSGLSLPGWVERPETAPQWSEEASDRWRSDFAAAVKKARGGEIPVLEEGMVYKTGGVTPEDAELLAARTWTNEQIASLYGMKCIPPDSDEQRQQFYSDVLPDITGQCCAFFNLHLLKNEYDLTDHYFEFNLDEKLMGDDRLKALTSAAGTPILTPNEARARANLPAKEGGDELVKPLNTLQGGKPSVDVMPIQNPQKPSQDGDFRSGEADRPSPAGAQSSLNGNGHVPDSMLVEHKGRLLLPRRVTKDRNRNEFASDLETVIKGFHDHFQRSAKSRKLELKAAAQEPRWEQRLADQMLPPTKRGVALIGGIEAARIGLDQFDMEQVENYLTKATLGKAKEIVKALKDALRRGKPEEVIAQGKDVEAPRAAMTFATGMSNFAVTEAARQSPDSEIRMKTWVTTSGNSAHPEMDGESVPLGETFSNGAEGPPADHPGCECLLEIDGGGHPPTKALQTQTKQEPVVIHNHITAPQPQPIVVEMHEGAFKSEVHPPPPAEINQPIYVGAPEVTTNIDKGAIQATFNAEAPPPADIRFDKGAFAISHTHHVEMPPPADIRFVEGAIQLNASMPDVTVEAAPAPDVHVEVKGREPMKKTVTLSDGRKIEIEEEGTDEGSVVPEDT